MTQGGFVTLSEHCAVYPNWSIFDLLIQLGRSKILEFLAFFEEKIGN